MNEEINEGNCVLDDRELTDINVAFGLMMDIYKSRGLRRMDETLVRILKKINKLNEMAKEKKIKT